jgi:hypothetical protein
MLGAALRSRRSVRFAAAAGLQGVSLARAIVSRALGLPDLLVALAGWRPAKKLRVRVVVLRDERGAPLVREDDVRESLGEAQRVLGRQARVDVVPAGDRLVETLAESAPAAALEHPCSAQGLWRADLGSAGAYFRQRLARGARIPLGLGAPITVFVVRDVVGKCGCSLGPLGDYVTIDRGGLVGRTNRILAHELGHSCGLRHSTRDDNLMRPRGPGERLTRLQAAILRSSRHVTYF